MLRLLCSCIGTEANFLSYGPDVIQYLGASYDYGIFFFNMLLLFFLCFKWYEIIAKKVPLCTTELIVSQSIPVFQLLLLDSRMLKSDREEDSAT